MKLKDVFRELLASLGAGLIFAGYLTLCGIGKFSENVVELLWKLGGDKEDE